VSKYGIGNRLVRGIADCVAMRWWRRRIVPARRLLGDPPALVPARDPRPSGSWRGPLLLGAFLASCAVLLAATPLGALLGADGVHALQHALRAQGPLAAPAFVLATASAVAIGAPRTVFSVLGGALYGFALGALLEVVGSLLGGTIAFLLVRHLDFAGAHRWLRMRLPAAHRMMAGVAERGFTAALALRSFPVGNGLLTTVLLCLSGVSLRDYVLGSALGMLPASFTYALLGSAAHGQTALRVAVSATLIAAALSTQRWLWPRAKLSTPLRP
jgi:uncharacterized membrane protein YdjX (TVP38/TMEM64 family)